MRAETPTRNSKFSHFHRHDRMGTFLKTALRLKLISDIFVRFNLTDDIEARQALLHALGVNIKDAVVAAAVSSLHFLECYVASVVMGDRQLHILVLVTDAGRHPLFVCQNEVVVLVEPAHLVDLITWLRSDVAAEQ